LRGWPYSTTPWVTVQIKTLRWWHIESDFWFVP